MKRLILFALLLLAAIPASASIALFTDGRSMKVKAYHVVDLETIELTLKSGGSMSIPLRRVDRIIDDEVEDVIPPAIAAEVKKIVDNGVFPRKSWRFDEKSRPLFKSKFNETIIEAARKFDVDAALVSAVIKAESDFNPRELSNKGAQGLMQLMPATAERFGVTNAFDPVANIYAGVRYLHWLLQTFDGNADLAIAAYNAGEGAVWKYNGVPPYQETITYIHRIARHIRAVVSPVPQQTAAADSGQKAEGSRQK